MKNKICLLLLLTILPGALTGCGKSKEVKQLTITMVDDTHGQYIAKLPEVNVECQATIQVDTREATFPITKTTIVDYVVGSSYRTVLLDSIFLAELGRRRGRAEEIVVDYVEFATLVTRYGYTPHFSFKSDMSDYFREWTREVTGNEIFIQLVNERS